MRKSHRFLCCAVAASLLALPLSACKSSGIKVAEVKLDNEGKTIQQWLEVDKQNPVTIKVVIEGLTNPSASSSAVLAELAKRTGTTVEIAGIESDQLQMLLASKDFPDVICMNRNANFYTYLDSGYMRELSPLLECFAPTVTEMFQSETNGNLFDLFKDKDGKIYYLTENNDLLREGERHPEDAMDPTREQDELPWHSTFYVQYPKVQEVYGKPIDSLESFYEALVAFKAVAQEGQFALSMDKEAAGDILWAGLSAYGYKCTYKGGLYVTKDGENYMYGLKAPDALPFLLYMNRLYREGLVDPDGPLQSYDVFIRKMNRGNVFGFVGNYFAIYETNRNLGAASSEERKAISYIPQCVKADGVEQVWQYNAAYTGARAVLLPATSPNAARIARLFEYLYTDEGTVLQGWGIEGEDYIVGTDGKRDLNQEIYDKMQAADEYNVQRGILSLYKLVNLPTFTTDGQPAFNRYAPFYSSDAGTDPRDVIIRQDSVYNWHDDWKGTFWKDFSEMDIVLLSETKAAIASSRCASAIKDGINQIIMAKSEDEARRLYQEAVDKMNSYGIADWEAEINRQIHDKR